MNRAKLCGASVLALTMCWTGHGLAQEADVEEVVITGSRIARSDYVAESPIVTLPTEAIEAIGPTTIDQLFNNLPQFTGIQGSQSNNNTKQGRANANLRGLGISRTLVLLDGRRMQPSDADGAVDLNNIVTSLVESVEIITGGASAVYGSDAVAGVVNFKTKRRVEGLEVEVQYGVTSRDDGKSMEGTLLYGGEFADGRGSALFALSYMDRESVFGGNRPFFINKTVGAAIVGGTVGSVASNLPSQAALTELFVNRYGGTVSPARNQTYALNRDGTLVTKALPVLNNRYPDHDPYVVIGDRLGFSLSESQILQPPLTRASFFGKGDYQLSDMVELYTQFMYTNYRSQWTRNSQSGSIPPDTGNYDLPLTNPFVSADLRYLMMSRPRPNDPIPFGFGTGRVGPFQQDQTYNSFQFLLGLKGDTSFGWTWDAYGSAGKTSLNETQAGFFDVRAMQTLLNAPDGGASICPGGYNPFLPDVLADDPAQKPCFDYLHRILKEHTSHHQEVLEATTQGKVFDLPAGEVQAVFGVGYRRNGFEYEPDSARVARTVSPDQSTAPVDGEYTVREAFTEVLIPLISEFPLIKQLDLDIAYRWGDYSVGGTTQSYKASVDWQIIDSFRLRGGYQRALRAPSLFDINRPPERESSNIGNTVQGGGDPCTSDNRLRNPTQNPDAAKVRQLCLDMGVPASVIDLIRFGGASTATISAGNTNLKAETADTYTIGAVWRSPFSDSALFSRLSASIDYYQIEVKDAIGIIAVAISLQRCFNADGQSNPGYSAANYYCSLVPRDPISGGFLPGAVIQPTLNLAQYRTSGIDAQIDWGFEVPFGRLDLNLLVNYLGEYAIQNVDGAPFQDFAGTIGNSQIDPNSQSFPDWKASASATYSFGPVAITLAGRWVNGMSHSACVGVAACTQPSIAARAYADISARWDINESLQLRGGVRNIADTEPPEWVIGNRGDPATHDVIQRRYFVGLSAKF